MAKTGFERLIEALRASGVDMGDMGGSGNAKADSASEEAPKSSSSNGRKSKGSSAGHPPIDLSFIENIHGPRGKGGWIALIAIAILAIGILYWWFHPPISINSADLWMLIGIICLAIAFILFVRRQSYKVGSGKIEKSPKKAKRYGLYMIAPLAVIVIGLVGALFSNAIIPGNAEKYSTILTADDLAFTEDIQEVNYSEIPVIDRNSAILLGNREMGTIPEYVSQFEVSNLYTQINYKGEPVRVSPLNYADLFKWFANRDTGIPAYSLVNMTTQNSEIVRLGDHPIFYSASEPLERNIDRYVQLKYPFYIFDQFAFEIDEEGNPWWVCPVRTFTIGLFGGYTIDRAVLCNATTGECQELGLQEIPEWVDHVFPADLLIEQYNWYGSYHNGWLNSFLGQEGVVRTTPGSDGMNGYNYIAKDDDVWVYTGVTSATADDSIIGFILVNQRTHEAHFYSVAGATEASAMASAEGQVQNLRYTATFPLLINVANQPTYFMALKDSAGLVKKFAMVDIQRYQNVAVGDTVADTQTAYESLLASNGILTSSEDLTDVERTSGIISDMTQAVIDSNSHFYVMLAGDDNLYDFALPGLLDILRYKVGDAIEFTYLTTEGSNTVYSIIGQDGEEVIAVNPQGDDASSDVETDSGEPA